MSSRKKTQDIMMARLANQNLANSMHGILSSAHKTFHPVIENSIAILGDMALGGDGGLFPTMIKEHLIPNLFEELEFDIKKIESLTDNLPPVMIETFNRDRKQFQKTTALIGHIVASEFPHEIPLTPALSNAMGLLGSLIMAAEARKVAVLWIKKRAKMESAFWLMSALGLADKIIIEQSISKKDVA